MIGAYLTLTGLAVFVLAVVYLVYLNLMRAVREGRSFTGATARFLRAVHRYQEDLADAEAWRDEQLARPSKPLERNTTPERADDTAAEHILDGMLTQAGGEQRHEVEPEREVFDDTWFAKYLGNPTSAEDEEGRTARSDWSQDRRPNVVQGIKPPRTTLSSGHGVPDVRGDVPVGVPLPMDTTSVTIRDLKRRGFSGRAIQRELGIPGRGEYLRLEAAALGKQK